MIALAAFASYAILAAQDSFPELRRDVARTQRGLVILASREAAWSELATERHGPRVRLAVANSGAASGIDAESPTAGADEIRIRLLPETSAVVDDPDLVARLADTGAFVLAEASAVDWSRALYPRDRRTELAGLLWRRHLAGADVIAFGRSAAAIGAVCPLETTALEPLGWRERNPRKHGRSLSFWSLGFLPWALVDVAGTPEASFGRLVERAWRDRMRLCVWLPEGAALVADVAAGRATARGPAPVLWLDLKRARRSRHWLLGGRLSILRPGGTWEHEQRRLRPHEGTLCTRRTSCDEEQRITSTDAFGDRTLAAILAHLDRPSPARTLRIVDEKTELVLQIDDDSTLYTTEHGTALADRVRFDLHERD